MFVGCFMQSRPGLFVQRSTVSPLDPSLHFYGGSQEPGSMCVSPPPPPPQGPPILGLKGLPASPLQ